MVLAGRVLGPSEMNGLAALLAGRPAAETDGPLIAQLMERLLAGSELRVLSRRSGEALTGYGAEAMGVALRLPGQWHLGALISEASGSCGWFEALSLGGVSLIEVTLYPEYEWPDTVAATRVKAGHLLVETLFPGKWDAAQAEQTRLQAQQRFASEGAFVGLPGGALHLSAGRPDVALAGGSLLSSEGTLEVGGTLSPFPEVAWQELRSLLAAHMPAPGRVRPRFGRADDPSGPHGGLG